MGGRAFLVAGAMLALVSPFAQAAGWSGFYTSTTPPAPAMTDTTGQPATASNVCLREILRAQVRYGIPDNLLLAIGLQEAGTVQNGQLTIWPWAVNAEGEGRIFATRTAALAWVDALMASGVKSIDLGCLQINMRWHPDAFRTPLEGFDPAVNVDYAARFLLDLYARSGDWMQAAGSYHSLTPDKAQIYLERLNRNVVVANARIDEFIELASLTGEVPAHPRAAKAEEPEPRDGIFWSAWLSLKDGGEHRRGIYSGRELQPALPNFTDQF